MDIRWLLPLCSGALNGLSRNVIRNVKLHSLMMVMVSQWVSIPVAGLWLYRTGMPTVDWGMFAAILAVAIPLEMATNVLTIKAHKVGGNFDTVPYLALSPLILLVSSPIMGGGTPSILGYICIPLIALGLYILNMKPGQTSIIAAARLLAKNKGALMMLLVAIVYGIDSNLDYLAIQASSPAFYLLAMRLTLGSIMIPMTMHYSKKKDEEEVPPFKFIYLFPLLLFIGIAGAAQLLQQIAYDEMKMVPYVIVGKRVGLITFTIVIGLILGTFPRFKERYTKEREHLQYRIPAILLILSAMTALMIWGGL